MKIRITRQRLLVVLVAFAGVTLIVLEVYVLSPAVRIETASLREAVGADGSLVGMFRDTDPQVRLAASAALTRRGPKAVPALLSGAEHPDPQVRAVALTTLGQIGPPARDAFATLRERARNDPDPDVREAGIRAMASVGEGDPEALTALVAILEAGDNDGRLVVARTLGVDSKWKVAGAVEALARSLKDTSAKVREQAAESLGAMAPVSAPAVPALTGALQDSMAEVRAEAAEALGSLAAFARSAVPGLILALNDPEPRVRREAAGSLERIAGSWGEGEMALRQEAVRALQKAGPNAPP